MFRIGRMTDYALVILSRMARGGAEHVHTAGEVAQATDFPLPTVTKILKQLAREGLLEGIRGARGGYRLARDTGTMSMLEVLEAMEGPVALAACVEGVDARCVHQTDCGARGPWERINAAVRAALSSVPLADVAESGPSVLVPLVASGRPSGAASGSPSGASEGEHGQRQLAGRTGRDCG